MINRDGTITEPAHLELKNVSVAYNNHPVLEELTFSVPHGSQIAVVGPNGAGKSTLFKALVGLLPVCAGQILIHGLPIGHHQDCVAYVPQREEVDWRFPVTVLDVVLMGRYGRLKFMEPPARLDHQAALQALQQMGVADLARHSLSDLSGGQQQRVFLARALAQEPHILLMDEPFTGVDVTTRQATLSLLDHLRQQQVTAMISTHDLNLAGSRFDAVILLNRYLVAYGKAKDVFRQENLSKAFGSSLLVTEGGVMLVDECCPPDEEHGHQEKA